MSKRILSIIPAAGRGSRMLSLTDNCAKSMIPVAGKPLISYLLDQLISANLKDVVIIVGYQKNTIIDYVNMFYKDKLNIIFVEQKELLGLGHAIYQATQQVNVLDYDSIFIMLGDAIFNTNKIFNFEKSYIACEEMIDYSRWCIAVEEDNYLVELLDKPTLKPKRNLALVGAYYFNNSKLFLDSVTKAIHTGITIKNEYQISTAIEFYKRNEPISILTIDENEWFDFGELDTYNRNRRKFNQSRFFNNVKYDNNSITKRSESNNKKIQKEICWFLALPDSLKKYCPKLLNFSLDDADSNYTLEYCSGNSLQEMWLYNNLSYEAWEKIIKQILYILDDFKNNSANIQVDLNAFIENQLKARVNLEEFFKDRLIINGKVYENYAKFFLNYLEDFKSRMNNKGSIFHGDMVFSNIIYDASNSELKLIDPRGDFCGKIIYGDTRYDIAKLAQCIIGDYDYIVNDLFVLTDDGYELYLDKDKKFKYDLFKLVTSNYNVNDILFITAIQFMTMIPLHSENKDHQLLMKYKAYELLGLVQERIFN